MRAGRTAFMAALAVVLALLAGCGPGPGEAVDYGSDLLVMGKTGRQRGQFSRPRAVAVTAKGELVVIDRTGRVQVFAVSTGEFLRQWRLPAFENGTPTGISVDPLDDTLWVADTHYERILQYSAEGELILQFGEAGEEPGKFIFPTDVTPDPDGKTLWITEYGRRNRIMQFGRDGTFIREWGEELFQNVDLERPMALVVSPEGDLFVVDAGNNRINVYDRDGALKRRFGVAGGGPGEMRYPLDMAMDGDGHLVIVEFGNSRVSRYSRAGEWLGSWGGPGHGPGEFFSPWGLALGPGGEIVVADTNNNRLQILSRPGRYFSRDAGSGERQAAAPP